MQGRSKDFADTVSISDTWRTPKSTFYTTFQLLYATIISADGRRLMQVI